MTATADFEDWAIGELNLTDEEVEALKLTPVFDLFISRLEAARARGAADPLQTVTAKLRRRQLSGLHQAHAGTARLRSA